MSAWERVETIGAVGVFLAVAVVALTTELGKPPKSCPDGLEKTRIASGLLSRTTVCAVRPQ